MATQTRVLYLFLADPESEAIAETIVLTFSRVDFDSISFLFEGMQSKRSFWKIISTLLDYQLLLNSVVITLATSIRNQTYKGHMF